MGSLGAGFSCLIAAGLSVFLVPPSWRGRLFSGGVSLALAFFAITAGPILWLGGSFSSRIVLPWPAGEIYLSVDPLAAFFLLIIVAMGAVGAFFASGYLASHQGEKRTAVHYLILGLFLAAMAATVIIQSVFAFLAAWEIMSLSSFLLILFEDEKEDIRRAALNYLVAMQVSFILIAIGLIALGQTCGNRFSDFSPLLAGKEPRAIAMLCLLFTGFGVKAGFVPLHTWLPRAHPAAPSHISGLMSGVMIKIGIYGILRFILLGAPSAVVLAPAVLAVGVISGLYGVMKAIPQHDIKKLLAYHSVENIGIIGIGIGAGLVGMKMKLPILAFLGFSGALLHVLNHSIFKSLLFYSSGSVYRQTGTRNIELLGGLAKRMPYTALLFFTGAVAISGLPLFNGFVSEFLIYMGFIKGGLNSTPFAGICSALAIASLAAIGAMALICFTKAFGIMFLGIPRSSQAAQARETLFPMRFSGGILALSCLLLGVFPLLGLRFVREPAMKLCGGIDAPVIVESIGFLRHVSHFLWVLSAALIGFFFLRRLLLRGKIRAKYKTWDCGYSTSSPRLQYTASSFAAPFVSLLKPVLGISEKHQSPEGLFPEKAAYSSSSEDLFDRSFLQPFLKRLREMLEKLAWLQGGHTQRYLLYGLLFLLISIIWALWGGR